jgi:acyl-[acyl carrier protein]--UDP-N-acetylglucosamine O-acyltransferase
MGADNFHWPRLSHRKCPQDLGFQAQIKSRIEIGNANVIREHCTIHRGPRQEAHGSRRWQFLMVGAHRARLQDWERRRDRE